MLWCCPAEMDSTPVAMVTGVLRERLVPSPSWPLKLYPHPRSVPSVFRIKVCPFPAETAETPSIILTGVDLSSFVPSPSWPW